MLTTPWRQQKQQMDLLSRPTSGFCSKIGQLVIKGTTIGAEEAFCRLTYQILLIHAVNVGPNYGEVLHALWW